ncbi:hypothetical protein HTVC168P_gp37 [Pelagibacter phage HTVC168P]|nr:hypothetical protein HTVC168P_gp37 [Pelagibacter phage HTVC168P]
MAYKSRVTNKYMGATFAGQVNAANRTETSDLINILQRDVNPALRRIYDKGVQNKKDAAVNKMKELYATKDTETINQEILDGVHPELSGRYVQKTVEYHRGRHEAVDAIAKIEENKSNYDFQTTNLPAFYKEYLPSFADKDGSYALGFAAVFNNYKAKEALRDAEVRSNYAQTKKIEEGVKIISAQDVTDVWSTANSLKAPLPPEEGDAGIRYMYSNEEVNQVVMSYAENLYNTATSTDEIDRALKILNSSRGIGKDGMKLGSLASTKRKDVSKLIGQLNSKRVTIENQNRVNEKYTQEQEVKKIFSGAFADNEDGTPKTFLERKKFRDKLEKIDPRLTAAFDELNRADRFADTDPRNIDQFKVNILLGEYDSLEEMVKAFQNENIPTSQLTTAISYYEKQQGNRDKGLLPIYQTNTTYSSQMDLITASVKGNFTSNGIFKSNGATAVMNATNYAIVEIEEFEQNYIKKNGEKPTNQERREFMVKLGDYITKTFTDDQTDPDIMTMTEKEQSEREAELQKELQAEQNQQALQSITDNITSITENIASQIQALPKYEDTGMPDALVPGDQEGDFNRKQRTKLIKDTLADTLNVTIDDNFIKYLLENREAVTPMIESLSKAYGVDANRMLQLIKQISTGS